MFSKSWQLIENAWLAERTREKRKIRRNLEQDSTETAQRQEMLSFLGFLSNLQNMFSMFIM